MSCPHDPKIYKGMPIGMYHCPECGEMVLAGLDHPEPMPEPTSEELRALDDRHDERGRFVCYCGWSSCGGGRGCGDCSDCYGEHCECHLLETDEFPHGEDHVPWEY